MEADAEYEIPLRDQRCFGAGIKRKRINFVPSTTTQAGSSTVKLESGSAAEKYLAIVFNKNNAQSSEGPDDSGTHLERSCGPTSSVCPLCHRTVASEDDKTVHESSIVHQICLQHSHPPSAIDRSRKGLAVLQTQGWDPDARRGLGAQGEGVLYPVKAKDNPKRAGLGADPIKLQEKAKPTRLDAGKIRALEKQKAQKAHDLRNSFYRSEYVERYLGQNQHNTTLDLKATKRAKSR